eukprot:scaffold63505_cov28-Tisochrysis_lutea.AAC.1
MASQSVTTPASIGRTPLASSSPEVGIVALGVSSPQKPIFSELEPLSRAMAVRSSDEGGASTRGIARTERGREGKKGADCSAQREERDAGRISG